MKSEIKKLRNLGVKSENILNSMGVFNLAQIKKIGPEKLFIRVKKKYPTTSICLLYALIGATYDKYWVEVARLMRGKEF